jgi:hypothetical protein
VKGKVIFFFDKYFTLKRLKKATRFISLIRFLNQYNQKKVLFLLAKRNNSNRLLLRLKLIRKNKFLKYLKYFCSGKIIDCIEPP